MSAKHGRKSAKKEIPAVVDSPAPPPSSPAALSASTVIADPGPAWIDSTDPRKRRFGKIVLIALWIYVAALWLLALDQTFHWGIFGPKAPVVA